jgi:hypothetical protein
MRHDPATDALPALDHLYIDALFLEQQCGIQAGQAGADDDDLRAVLGRLVRALLRLVSR